MKKENILIDKIDKISNVITTDFPELIPILDEVNEKEINKLNPTDYNIKLQNYYDKLVVTLRNHVAKQQLNQINQRTHSGHL